MSYIIILSDYRQTKELNYLIKDKQGNYFSNQNCFAKILDNFLDKLKDEDRKIAIITLDQIFPELKLQNNMTQRQVYQSINDSPTKSDKPQTRNFNTPDSRSNKMVLDITYYQEFDNVTKTQDWMRLQQMVQLNQFDLDGKYPNNFRKLDDFDNEQIQRAPKAMHYIIMLDDSNSMEGDKFDSAKSGIIAFLSEIHKLKNKDSRVTIIMFNSDARVVVDSEVINPKEQEGKIVFEGGGTNFDEPFIYAYQKIIERTDFDKFYSYLMFFYTDGAAHYPSKALSQFEQLRPEQKQKIELIVCSEEDVPYEALQQVVAFFKEKQFASAELQHSIKPEQIGSTWIETIRQKTHQILKFG